MAERLPADLTEAEASALLLAVPDLGPAAHGALLRAHGSALATLESAARPGAAARLASLMTEDGSRLALDPGVARELVTSLAILGDRLTLLRSAAVRIVTFDDPAYPARLRAVEQPPPLLFAQGAIEALHAEHVVAIVGTRRPTEHGRVLATRIAALVGAAGATVVSGLALGIDGASHAAAVHDAAPTAAVLGSGHLRLVPQAHRLLAERILATGGVVVSEFWPDQPPDTWTFPRRNRVISGVADATVVVEAGERSGALITAHHALEQGRELFVVPGRIGDPASAGCLQWLRTYPGAARIVAGVHELIDDLGLVEPGPPGPPSPRRDRGRRSGAPASLGAVLLELGSTARGVAVALASGHGTLDDLVAATGLEPATVLGAITLLELRGLVLSTFGRYRAAGSLAAAPDAGAVARA
ncbi:MAG TPA: DNA-processing protein DprA [Candidatus Limnocylindrales bacterium]|nr:DNA-processing protein DprA [Candidatus Limnocylindrales bacterium]